MEGDLGLVHLNAFPASRLAAAGQTFAFAAVPDDKGRPQARLVSAAGRHAVVYAHNDSDGGTCSFLDLNHRAEEALSLAGDPSGRLIAVCERRSQSSSSSGAATGATAGTAAGATTGAGASATSEGDAVAQLSVYHASSRECLRTMTFRVPRAAFGGDAAARAAFGFLQAEFSGDAASTYLVAYAAAPGGACGHIVLFKWRSATAVAVHALAAGVRVSRLRVSPHGVARADGSLAPLSTLQLSISGPGLCRSLRVTQEGGMAEAPLLHPTREAAADFVDHCWLRAGPPPVVTAGATAGAGLDAGASGDDAGGEGGTGTGGGASLGGNKRAWAVSVARERRMAAITADGHVYIIAKADSSSGPGAGAGATGAGGPTISKSVAAPASSSLAGVAVAEIWELKTVMRIALPSIVVKAQTAALQGLPGGAGSTLADAGLGWGLHDGKQSATGGRHLAGAGGSGKLGGGRAAGAGGGEGSAAAREALASSGPAGASVLALKAGILASAGSETLVLHGIAATGRGFVVAGSHGLIAVFERADTASGARMKGMAAAVMAAAAGSAAATSAASGAGLLGGHTGSSANGAAVAAADDVGTLLPATSDPFVCVRALLAEGGLTIRSMSLSLSDDVAALLTLQRGLCTIDLAAAELDDGLDASASSAAAAGLGALRGASASSSSSTTSSIVLPPAAGSIRLGVSLSPVLGAGTHTRAVSHLSLSVSQPRMLTCAADGTIRLWDYQDARCESVLHTSSAEAGAGGNSGGGGAGSGAALAERLKASVGLSSSSSPAGGKGAAPGSPMPMGGAALSDPNAPTDILAAARADANDALSVTMHPSGLMAAAGFRERVVIYNACAASLALWTSVTLRGAYCVAYSTGGAYLAVSAGAVLHIYSAWTMAPLLVLAGHTSQIRDIAWAANDSCIASVGDDGGVLLWNLRSESTQPPSQLREDSCACKALQAFRCRSFPDVSSSLHLSSRHRSLPLPLPCSWPPCGGSLQHDACHQVQRRGPGVPRLRCRSQCTCRRLRRGWWRRRR